MGISRETAIALHSKSFTPPEQRHSFGMTAVIKASVEDYTVDGLQEDMPEPSEPKAAEPETPEKQKRSFWLQFGRYSQLAFALPAGTVAGWLLGSLFDRWLHTSWIRVVGLLLGIVAGLVEVVRTASRDMR